jgi:hypothetical protein
VLTRFTHLATLRVMRCAVVSALRMRYQLNGKVRQNALGNAEFEANAAETNAMLLNHSQGPSQKVRRGLVLVAFTFEMAACASERGGSLGGGDGGGDGDGDLVGSFGGSLGGAGELEPTPNVGGAEAVQPGTGGDSMSGPELGGMAAVVPVRPDEVVGPTGTAFVPEGLEYVEVGTGEVVLTLVASTLVQESGLFDEVAWFGAFRNDGATNVCIPGVFFEFYDAAGLLLADDHAVGAIHAPMYLSYGSPSPCLGPGEIGMMEVTTNLQDLNVDEVVRIEYFGTGALNLSAEKLTEVNLESISLQPIYVDSVHAVGSIKNNWSSPIEWPEIFVYAVDTLGRPYGLMTDIENLEIAPGGAWEFDTLAYDGEVENFVVFMEYSEPF